MPSPNRRAVEPPPDEWTAEDFARARPLKEVRPDIYRQLKAAQTRRRRGQQRTPTKVAISLRVERAALAAYRATGRGWQSRLSADISAAAARRARRRAD
jgi:uncharacterized protein (DUF4415 family)